MDLKDLSYWHNLAAIFCNCSIFILYLIHHSHASVCLYPHYSDRHACGIHDKDLLNGWICDPDNTISMSEVYLIDDTLKRIYAQTGQNCQCSIVKKKPCWYKFGFAFTRELNASPIEMRLNSCRLTECRNQMQYPFNFVYKNNSIRTYDSLTSEAASLYSQNYARMVRELWDMGDCGEDILFLIVHAPPESLIGKHPKKSMPYRFTHPMIFVSYGERVVNRFEVADIYTLPYVLQPLRRIVEQENVNLLNTYPLNKVLNNLVLKTVEVLQKIENSEQRPRSKNHIPLWAWGIFGACVVACIFMAIGLYLIRTTTRRDILRGKGFYNIDASRRWKPGFVGNDDGQPTTYVNLVNLLMPRPQTGGMNVVQQF